MGALLIFGLLLVAIAAGLVVRAVMMPRIQVAQRLGQVGAYGYPSGDGPYDETPEGPLSAALDRIAERLGDAVAPRLSSTEHDEVQRLLAAAGIYGTTPRRLLGYRALGGVMLPVALLWLSTASNAAPGLTMLMVILGALVGWSLPLMALRSQAERRRAQIDHQLPELVDSLIVTVEAGLGFAGALRMAAKEMSAPLGAEIRLALQEQSMGMSTGASLENMLNRVETPAMRSFVRSVSQGDSLGVSIGQILRAVAIEMRSRRRAAAEEKAQKAPVKMLFPLIFLIFPSIFIVLLYPGLKTFFENISGIS